MPLTVQQRNALPPAVARELDHILATLRTFLAVSFNEDGTLSTLATTDNEVDLGDVTASHVLGRGSGSTGAVQEIALTAPLSMSGQTIVVDTQSDQAILSGMVFGRRY